MTKEEFIDGYVRRSGIEKYQTQDGFFIEGEVYTALPCRCGEGGCEGWAMVKVADDGSGGIGQK